MSVYYPGGIISATERIPNKASANGVWYLPTVAQYTNVGVWPNITLLSDNVFSYNTLLIHADNTNGANNTVFLDSSTNLIPFTGTYSNYFNASNYLSYADSAPIRLGSNNFTVEGFFYPTNVGSGPQVFMLNGDAAGSAYAALRLTFNNTGTVSILSSTTGTSWTLSVTSTSTITNNIWYHIAVVRNGTTMTVYVNGVSYASGSITGSLMTGTINWIGEIYYSSGGITYYSGYISNFRIVNGTALYTSNFTPPTSVLTAIANTALLTCQSSTIVDNSPNAITITNNSGVLVTAGGNFITTNGHPYQGTFSPFSQTGWSNYFNGSTDYIQATVAAPGTNFTVEGWVNLPVVSAVSSAPTFIAINNSASSTGFELYVTTSGWAVRNNTQNILGVGGSAGVGTAPAPGTWHHVAFVRNSGTVTLYVDGTAVGANSTSFTFTDTAFTIGNGLSGTAYYTGYVSNVRYVSDTALYTSNFTPSTTPLAISGVGTTQILTSQSNRFVDNSTTPKTFTINGTPSIQPVSPFPPGVAYSTSSVGGSMSSPSGSDYLAPSSPALPASGQFTVEGWIYTTASATQIIYSQYLSSDSTRTQIGIDNSSGYKLTFIQGSATQIYGASVVPLNQWNYFAFTRDSSNNLRIYLNGNLDSTTASYSYSFYQSNMRISGVTSASTYPVQGYLSGLKISNTALYTGSSFTLPTAPPTASASTTLLTNFTNAGIFDQTAKNDISTYGTAAISTTQSKFGGSSIYFDGSTGAIRTPSSPLNTFGTGDFTIEFWAYLNSTTGSTNLFDMRNGAPSEVVPVIYQSSGTLYYYVNGSNVITGTSLSTGQWYHIAVCRASGSTRMFVNGTQVGSTYTDTNSYIQEIIALGYYPFGSSGYFSGYIDELRVSRYARYTANFTPSTTAFLNQ